MIKAVERELPDCLHTPLALPLLWITLLENILVIVGVCHIVQERLFKKKFFLSLFIFERERERT